MEEARSSSCWLRTAAVTPTSANSSRPALRCVKGESLVTWREVCEKAEGSSPSGAATGCHRRRTRSALHRRACEAFGDRLYVLLTRHRERTTRSGARIRDRARRYRLPTRAAVENALPRARAARRADVLTCIRHGVTWARAVVEANDEHALKRPEEFEALFADDPASCARTLEIAERCSFTLAEIRYRYPAEALPDAAPLPTGAEPHLQRRSTLPDGIPKRSAASSRRNRGDRELEYDGYFLTCTRSSASAASAHPLPGTRLGGELGGLLLPRHHRVDPVRMGLLFELPLAGTGEPPDIDLDIEHERREEVIQHVYAKYGRTTPDGGELHPLPRPLLGARHRQGARLRRDRGRSIGEVAAHLRQITPEILADAGSTAESDALHLLRLSEEIGTSRGTSPSIRRFLPDTSASTPWCRSRTPRWKGAPSSSGTRKTRNLELFKIDLLAIGALTNSTILRPHPRALGPRGLDGGDPPEDRPPSP